MMDVYKRRKTMLRVKEHDWKKNLMQLKIQTYEKMGIEDVFSIKQ